MPNDRRLRPPRSSGTASATSARTATATATTAGVPFTAPTVTRARLRRPLAGDLSSWPVTAAPDDRRPTDALAHIAGLPGVADAVERARAAVDDLRGHRVLRRSSERVSSESALRGARASAALAGSDLPLDALRRSVGDEDGGDGVVRGALRVAAEIGPLQATWSPGAPAGRRAAAHPGRGRPRAGRRARPAGPGSRPRLSGLGDLLSAPTTAPALVVAAVVHAELATMGAFAVGAGVVGRAAGRLTMVGRGLDPSAVSVPEVGHVELGRDVYLAHWPATAAATRTTSPAGWCTAPRPWCSVPARASPSARPSSAAPDRRTRDAKWPDATSGAPRGSAAQARQSWVTRRAPYSGDQVEPGSPARTWAGRRVGAQLPCFT